MNPKKKIAILGGGAGALACAFGLTEKPGWQDEAEITVYQLGWRLGGKGTSGRQADDHDRILEHGLHVWGGFYWNAFRVIRACYQEMNRPAGAPLATWDQAFQPQDGVTWMEEIEGRWIPWDVKFPPNGDTPGEGGASLSAWDYLHMLLAWMEEKFSLETVPPNPAASAPASSHVGLPGWVHDVLRIHAPASATAAASPASTGGVGTAPSLPGHALLTAALAAAKSIAADPAASPEHHRGLRWLLTAFRGWLVGRIDHAVETHDVTRRLWILFDLGTTMALGMLEDGVHQQGFEAIDGEDWAAWLGRHGASPLTLDCAIVRGAYDFIFAYQDGDPERPAVAAGTCTRCLLRLALEYKGAIFFKMSAGMGDVVFVPLYEALKRRGVKFEFFRRVRGLTLSPDHRSVASVTVGRQATVKGGADYAPLRDVMGLPCWPSEPFHDQLVEGEALKSQGVDLESAWSPWPDVAVDTLIAGRDFDQLVFGISLGAVPDLCAELIAADPRWRTMVTRMDTVCTQAVQLWLNVPREKLGWSFSTVLTAYAHFLETWSDMSQVIPRENWPPGAGPKNIAYFCGPMGDPAAIPPYSDHGYPARASDQAKRSALEWIENHAATMWPGAVKLESAGFDWDLVLSDREDRGPARFDTQYWRANINPSDRYVLSLPGTTGLRLRPGDSGFANLFLAGDWVRNGLDFGCVESAVMGGLLASRAMCGFPQRILGSD